MVNDPANWFELAGRLTAAEAAGLRSGRGKDVVSDFSKAESVNTNMLRKMQRARMYIEKNEATKLDALSSLPLSYVDVLSRIAAIDAKGAHDIALQIIKKPADFTYRRLLEVYDGIRAKRSKAGPNGQRHKSHVAQFKKDILSAASSGSADFLYRSAIDRGETVTFRPWKGGHEFVSPFMTSRVKQARAPSEVAVTTDNVDAFDCYLQYEDDPHELARDRVLRGSTEATFFSRLWFVLPAERSGVYENLIRVLGPSNLGILRFCARSSSFECTLEPTAPPSPDRRSMWTRHSIAYCAR